MKDGPPTPRQLGPVGRYFTDRCKERELLESCRSAQLEHPAPTVVVLRGLPGVGKTALAMKWLNEITKDYADGQLHLELGGPGIAYAVNPLSLLEQLLRSLGVDSHNIPQDSGSQRGMFRSMTAGRALILLLDDAVTAGQVATVLPVSAQALIVVTCTQRMPELATDGAKVVDLEPMDTVAVAEFLAKALPPHKLTATPEDTLERLAERCHGLPQLAHMAARKLSEDPFETITDLTERFDEAMADGDDEAIAGHDRSVRAEIDAFFHALPPLAARMYQLLGLHPGAEFDLWAAAAACETDARTARKALAELWRNGLIDDVGSAEDGRYRFSEIVGHHAETEAEAKFGAQEMSEVRGRYAAYYRAGVLKAANRGARRWMHAHPPERSPVLPPLKTAESARSWMRANLESILAAAEWCGQTGGHETVWQIAEASDSYLRENGRYADRLALMRMGVASASASSNSLAEARLRNQYGLTLLDLKRDWKAANEFSLALRLSQRHGDGRGQGATLECLGIAAQRKGADEEALGFFDRAEPFKAAMDRPQAMAVLGLLQARSLITLDRAGEALEHLVAALKVFQERDENGTCDEVNTAKALLERGRALTKTGYLDAATKELDRSLKIFTARNHIYQQARVREAMAETERSHTPQRWSEHMREAARLYRVICNDAEAERLERMLPDE